MDQRDSFEEFEGHRFVVLISAFMRGGCERQAFLLARELRRRHGLDAQVWALKYDGQYRDEFESAGIPTNVLHWKQPHRGWVQRCLPVVRQLRKGRVDILLPFTTWPNVVAGLTYRLSGIRLCIWGERHCGGERVPGIERVAASQYRRFVANSSAGAKFLEDEMRIPRGRISFVPNGVEKPKIGAGSDWRARLQISPSRPLVVKVANLTPYKDHATLLRAWKVIQDKWSGAEKPLLALAGLQCDTYDECLRIVRGSGMQDTVRFLGSIPDVPDLLQVCDLAVFSSPNEGMPNGVMECMAHGKAIVASDLPGIRDLIGSRDDVLFRAGDVHQFAQKLLDLLQNRERREVLGAANQARMESEFSVERMTNRYLGVIQQNLRRAGWGLARRSKSIAGADARPGAAE